MDKTLQSLLTLASEGNVEHRCAALLVLGALKAQDDSVVKTVGAALGQANVVLKDYALRYFEEAQPKAGVSLVLPLLDDEDIEIARRQQAKSWELRATMSLARLWQRQGKQHATRCPTSTTGSPKALRRKTCKRRKRCSIV